MSDKGKKRKGRRKGSAKNEERRADSRKQAVRWGEDGSEKTGKFLPSLCSLTFLSFVLFLEGRRNERHGEIRACREHFFSSPHPSSFSWFSPSPSPSRCLSLSLSPFPSTSAHSLFRFSPPICSLGYSRLPYSFSSSLSCLPSFSLYHSEGRRTIHKEEDEGVREKTEEAERESEQCRRRARARRKE